MIWILLSQVSLIGQNSYPGATWVYLGGDFSGDGISDVVAYYGNDSVIIYRNLTSTPIAHYGAPSGYYISVYRLSGSTVLLTMQNYSTRKMQFKIYENLTNLRYTSPLFSYNSSGFISAGNYDGDSYADIIVSKDNTIYVYETTYSAGNTESSNSLIETPIQIDIISTRSRILLPVQLQERGIFQVISINGKTLINKPIMPSETAIEVNLTPGTYLYQITSPNSRISGKLIIN